MFYVYFIRSGEVGRPIKIGHTNNISKRMSAMQTGSPDDLHLICLVPLNSKKHAHSFEKWIHDVFSEQRIRGEWFYGSIKIKRVLNKHIFELHNIDWPKTREMNPDKFWRLDSYGYDINRIKKDHIEKLGQKQAID